MRRRLVLIVAATTLLVVAAFAIPLAALVRDVARDRAIAAAERDAAALAPVVTATQDPDLIAAAIGQTQTGGDGRLAVFLQGEQIGDRSDGNGASLALARQGLAFTEETADGVAVYSPVVTGEGETIVVRARVPESLLEAGVSTAWIALAGVGSVLTIAGCLLADRLARSLTREAGELAGTARALAAGDAFARATSGTVPEITDVAAALNALADRIDELRAAERERVADLSHRLRTPLTALRLEADRSGMPALIEGVDRLERDMTALISAARRPLHDGPVEATCDLAAVVRERAAFWSVLADDDGRHATADIVAGPVTVRLADDEAAAMLDALLTNVFTHTADGTPYAVSLRRRDRHAVLSVTDEGAGVEEASTLIRRGVSGGQSTGLGLDIVQDGARRAGGGVHIAAGPSGGLQVTVTLPVADPPS